VEGVGEECSVLEEVEAFKLVSGGDAGAGGGAGGTTRGAVFATGCVVPVTVGPNGCSLGIEVQWY
jgi:hypothetical protein